MTSPVGSNSQAGYSLIELLTVMAVIALVGAAAASWIPVGQDSGKLRDGVTSIMAELRVARNEAAMSGTPVEVRFDRGDRESPSGSVRHVSVPDGIEVAYQSAFEDPEGRLSGPVFFADGSNSGGEVVLMLDEARARVVLHWLTGRVSAQ